jgi:phosphoribosylformylglycinamidine (FGAM) synthase PurS component
MVCRVDWPIGADPSKGLTVVVMVKSGLTDPEDEGEAVIRNVGNHKYLPSDKT